MRDITLQSKILDISALPEKTERIRVGFENRPLRGRDSWGGCWIIWCYDRYGKKIATGVFYPDETWDFKPKEVSNG